MKGHNYNSTTIEWLVTTADLDSSYTQTPYSGLGKSFHGLRQIYFWLQIQIITTPFTPCEKALHSAVSFCFTYAYLAQVTSN